MIYIVWIFLAFHLYAQWRGTANTDVEKHTASPAFRFALKTVEIYENLVYFLRSIFKFFRSFIHLFVRSFVRFFFVFFMRIDGPSILVKNKFNYDRLQIVYIVTFAIFFFFFFIWYILGKKQNIRAEWFSIQCLEWLLKVVYMNSDSSWEHSIACVLQVFWEEKVTAKWFDKYDWIIKKESVSLRFFSFFSSPFHLLEFLCLSVI